MTFLKKLGSLVLKGMQIVGQFQGVVVAVDPKAGGAVATVSADLAQIANIIAQMEAVGQALTLAGPQKLAAAAPSVAQVILQSSILAHHTVENPTLFSQGAQKIADGMVDVLNSLKADVETTDKAA